jgi:hypothetical protein
VETAPVERERGAAGGGFRRTEEENSGEAAPARRLPTTEEGRRTPIWDGDCTERIQRERGGVRWGEMKFHFPSNRF